MEIEVQPLQCQQLLVAEEGGMHQLPQDPKKVSPGKVRATIKNNPFSALATATGKSAGAAKRTLPPHGGDLDLGSAGKVPHEQLRAVLLKKKSKGKGKSTFTGAIKKPHRYHPGTMAL